MSYRRLERVTKVEFLEDRDAERDFINKLQAPYRDPSGTGLAWLLGVVDDVSNGNTLNQGVSVAVAAGADDIAS